MRFYQTTWFQKLLYPSLTWKIDSSDSIYLTFDDGPTPEVTPWVLDELDKVGGKASFFCIGIKIEEHKDIAEQLLQKGHAIGNHTYRHLSGYEVDAVEYLEDIKKCDDQLERINVKNQLFRPPFGRIRKAQLRRLDQKKIIMWNYLSWDFSTSFKPEKSLKALKKAGPGDIVLFHDSEKAFANLKQILPELLAHYNSKGLKLEALR